MATPGSPFNPLNPNSSPSPEGWIANLKSLFSAGSAFSDTPPPIVPFQSPITTQPPNMFASAPLTWTPELGLGPTPGVAVLYAEVDESRSYIRSQDGYKKIGETIDAIMCVRDGVTNTNPDPKSRLSSTQTNRIGKVAQDVAALLTDTKPSWDYGTANRNFEQSAGILSKLSTFWYQHQDIDLILSDVLMYVLAGGTGYLYLYWDTRKQDIYAKALDPRNVFPIRPYGNKSLEESDGVIIEEKVSVSYVYNRYHIVVEPDSDAAMLSHLAGNLDSEDQISSPVRGSYYRNKQKKGETPVAKTPVVSLYTRFYRDPTVNTTSIPISIGEGTFKITIKPGEKLFPNLRMTVFAGAHILYDGPSFYWHGHVPVLKMTLQPYPWTYLGKAPLWDLLRLQDSLNKILRIIDNHAAQIANPGAVMDKNNVSKSQYDSFDSSRPGFKALQNPMAGKGIQIIPVAPLDPGIYEYRDWLITEMETLAGVQDLARMMDLKQIPSNDTVENIVHQLTPTLRMRSRIMEAFFREVAIQMAYNFAQWYTLTMRVTILGPGGLTMDDFDFDPGSLVPDVEAHVGVTADTLLYGPAPRYNRAQNFLRQFVYKISAGSLLNSAQLERSMMYAMLTRMGILDPITLLEQLAVPNIGVDQLPSNVRTILERLKWCQDNGLMAAANPVGVQAGASGPGAKASGQSPPRIVSKES